MQHVVQSKKEAPKTRAVDINLRHCYLHRERNIISWLQVDHSILICATSSGPLPAFAIWFSTTSKYKGLVVSIIMSNPPSLYSRNKQTLYQQCAVLHYAWIVCHDFSKSYSVIVLLPLQASTSQQVLNILLLQSTMQHQQQQQHNFQKHMPQ